MDADDPSAEAAASSSSSSPTSDDTFFDALDFLPSPPPSPFPIPFTTASPHLLLLHPPPPAAPLQNLKSSKSPSSPLPHRPPLPHPPSPPSTRSCLLSPIPLKPPAPRLCRPRRKDTGKDEDKDAEVGPRARTPTPAPGILEYLAMLVIKAVVFQVSALISCLSFPVRLLQWWFLFVTDPLGLVRRARAWALGVAGVVTARLGGGEGVGKVAQRLVWGSIWAVYVCV
ncbi:hypothetical protein PR202_gb12415 [Eleusine coracana subsp. coracana]|uniref:Uncharacterized protein n=1 Tax=Eleusine coracana subsp. coracana TaxID=191504 RepID=A0AAV5ERB5_ELECO|nr:hypothetical protein PR202_gb12415 [Eleusine coracana subsp. coracana]